MSTLYIFLAMLSVLGMGFGATLWALDRKARAEVEKTVLEANNRKRQNAEKIAVKPSGSVDDIINRL